jgi:signal transduction histidine kinase
MPLVFAPAIIGIVLWRQFAKSDRNVVKPSRGVAMKTSRMLLFWLFILITHQLLGAQMGRPFIRYYAPDEYRNDSQNWAVTQDHRGLMYFGGSKNVLEYDGVSWRVIYLSNNWICRSIATDASGIVWIGGSGELGYLHPDSSGTLGYVSLLRMIPDSLRNFKDIWSVFCKDDKVYFDARDYIFVWDGKRFKTIVPPHPTHSAFLVNGEYYIRMYHHGLGVLRDSIITLVPDGEKYAEIALYSGIALSPDSMLMASKSHGLFVFDGQGIAPFPTDFDDLLRESFVYRSMVQLEKNIFAIGTIKNGVLIFNRKGRLLSRIDKKSGLVSAIIYAMGVDRQNSLWLATDNGISRVEWVSPFRVIDKYDGLEGKVWSIEQYKNEIFVSVVNDIYRITPTKNSYAINRIDGLDRYILNFMKSRDGLFVADRNGISHYNERQKRFNLKLNIPNCFFVRRTNSDSGRVVLGHGAGMALANYADGEFTDVKNYDEVKASVRQIYEMQNGEFLIQTARSGIWHLKKASGTGMPTPDNYRIVRYGSEDGLPLNVTNHFFDYNGDFRVGTQKGIYTFNTKSPHFRPDSLFSAMFSEQGVSRPVQAAAGDLWFWNLSRVLINVVKETGQSPKVIEKPFRRIDHLGYVNTIKPDVRGHTLIGMAKGLVLHNADYSRPLDGRFNAIIRQIVVNADSIIFGGYQAHKMAPQMLNPGKNSLRFYYAATSYIRPADNEYQSLLEGYEEDWTNWSNETHRDITQIPPGRYVFKVRARNLYQTLSAEDVFHFEVLPPWYLTSIAWIVYTLIFIFLLYLLVKWRLQTLEKENLRLEKLIQERTQTIVAQAEELKQTQMQLFQSEKMSALGQMASGIAHEINTPQATAANLMFVLDGMVNQLKSDDKLDVYNDLKSTIIPEITAALNRISEITDAMLNFSRLEHKNKRLTEVKELIESILIVLRNRIKQKTEVKTAFNHQHRLNCWPGLLNQAIMNIVINATEAMPEKGTIAISTREEDGHLIISIADDGPGISEEDVGRIFDPFFTTKSNTGGTGLGLSIAHQIIEKHGGRIKVSAEVGIGSTFELILPMEK